MPAPELRISTEALAENWQALNARSNGRAGAVVKADGYGLGIAHVAPVLWRAGARDYFVATYDEAVELKSLLPEARIFELSGLSVYAPAIENILPVINAPEMWQDLDARPFALQFDTGMTRLGLDLEDAALVQGKTPALVMSHLACADEPSDEMNSIQLANFQRLAAEFPNIPKSLAATGGILNGADYHFDLTRPGIGIYGGAPYWEAAPVAQVALPVLQIREIEAGTKIGYGASFVADRPMRVATLLGGYADGLMRVLSNQISLFHGDTPCPLLGRVSMDSVVVDISALEDTPEYLTLFHPTQDVNAVAARAGTIAYEILTALGARYRRFEV